MTCLYNAATGLVSSTMNCIYAPIETMSNIQKRGVKIGKSVINNLSTPKARLYLAVGILVILEISAQALAKKLCPKTHDLDCHKNCVSDETAKYLKTLTRVTQIEAWTGLTTGSDLLASTDWTTLVNDTCTDKCYRSC